MHLKRLKNIPEVNDKNLFPCIKDLVLNGLSLDRFSSKDSIPNRQDITQYLAAWLKYVKVYSDICKVWMNEYCVDILSAISSSSKSKIRHSTKSNIKYIYTSDVIFKCERENNPYKASCEQDCPVYKSRGSKEPNKVHDIKTEICNKADNADNNETRGNKEKSNPSNSPLMRDKYRDQFNKAMEIVSDNIKKGIKKKNIIVLLNDDGFKSRTGKQWTASLLAVALKRYNKK